MKKKFFVSSVLLWSAWLLFGLTDIAGATQVHSQPEGLYAHQIAHLFFAFSMGILIYWLRDRQLVREKGWRLVQYAALFFILWNIDTIVVHYLDAREDMFQIVNHGRSWRAQIQSVNGSSARTALYYFLKMDHLLCVPAVVFLYAGLRQLLVRAQRIEQER